MWPSPPRPTMPTRWPGPTSQCRSGEYVVMPAQSSGADRRGRACPTPAARTARPPRSGSSTRRRSSARCGFGAVVGQGEGVLAVLLQTLAAVGAVAAGIHHAADAGQVAGGLNPFTSSPTSVTRPTISCPGTIGNRPRPTRSGPGAGRNGTRRSRGSRSAHRWGRARAARRERGQRGVSRAAEKPSDIAGHLRGAGRGRARYAVTIIHSFWCVQYRCASSSAIRRASASFLLRAPSSRRSCEYVLEMTMHLPHPVLELGPLILQQRP